MDRFKIAPIARGSIVCLSDDEDKKPIGKVLVHRPILINTYVGDYAYIIGRGDGPKFSANDLLLVYHDEISSVN